MNEHYELPCTWPSHRDATPDEVAVWGCAPSRPKCACGTTWPHPEADSGD